MVVRPILALALLAGCTQDDLNNVATLPSLDDESFRCIVQPILAKNCAFMDCHGNATRPLRIYAEQRFRLDIDWIDFETPLTDAELAANFETVRGFVGSNAETSLLTQKPLDVRAGGLYHGAAGQYGPDDVFINTDSREYRELLGFASGTHIFDVCPAEER